MGMGYESLHIMELLSVQCLQVMGYESLHIMELLSVQFLQVDDVILIITRN